MKTSSSAPHSSALPLLSSSKAAALIRFLEHLFSLLVVCLLLLAAATWTGTLFGRKIGPPEAVVMAVPEPDAQTLSKLGLEGESFTLVPADSAAWNILRTQDSEPQGQLVYTAPYTPDARGFAGPTPLYLRFSTEGEILALAMGTNAETPDFLRSATEGIFPKFTGLDASQAAQLQVDAVSGATYSSLAILANVQATLSQRYVQEPAAADRVPAIGWPRTFAVFAVLLLSLLVSLGSKPGAPHHHPQEAPSRPKNRRIKRLWRILVLILNVGVLGFWCGQFLSLSLLHGWIANGFDPVLTLPVLVILLLTVLLSFFGRKKHYCVWICPFGSLQELLSMLPFPKIRLPQAAFRIIPYIRIYILTLLLLCLWLFAGASVALDYEPFSAFLYQTATPAVTCIAAVFLLASCFVPRIWCKACCPLGSILDLAEDDRTPRAKPSTPASKAPNPSAAPSASPGRGNDSLRTSTPSK